MKVRDVMTSDVMCCILDDGLQTVAQMMVENDCGAIPVVEDLATQRLIGIITDRDIVCRSVAPGVNPLELSARDCMSEPCTSIHLDADIEECCRIMEQQQVRRVPVVDEHGSCCGIVALADIAQKVDVQQVGAVVRAISQSVP